jgi:uncharacterized protein (DUF305 family)
VEATEPESERVSFRPTIVQALVFAVALAFLTSVVVVRWTDREPRPNAASVGFFDDMTTHHYQALAMSRVYQRYGTDRIIGIIADEIDFEQSGDIRVMQNALRDWHVDTTPTVAMQWMDMAVPQNAQPGMATKAQMAALKAARGPTLDDQFTRLMINHHAAGAAMADSAVRRANRHEVRDLATVMRNNQRYEIEELQHERDRLGLAKYTPPEYMTM